MAERTANGPGPAALPPRFPLPKKGSLLALAVFAAFLGWSAISVKISFAELWTHFPDMWTCVQGMVRPLFDRFGTATMLVLQTLQMATVGACVGVLLGVPVAFFAARNHSPNRFTYTLARGLLTMVRTVPDLVWALVFIVWVGIGPFAGVLTLVVETVGFCGRFFADAFEDTEKGPAEALTALGARGVSVFTCATFPAALPAMTNTSLYALEKAVRASVVLGMVGAGGIGVELKNAMDFLDWGHAATIVLLVFAMVFVVERTSAWLRSRL
jgi:phosphonate transport system permease protein